MKRTALDLLQCPKCTGDFRLEEIVASETKIEEGVLICCGCEAWFPISHGIGFFLEDSYANAKAVREQFAVRHQRTMPAISIADSSLADKNAQIMFFAEEASQYDEFHTDSRFVKYLDQDLLKFWNGHFILEGRVLDLGCGTGMRTIPLAKTNFSNHFLALDICKDMVEIAAKRADAEGLTNVSFIVGDAQRPPVRSKVFDTVVGAGILHHVPDPQEVMKQVARVLVAQGVYLGIENNKTFFRILFELYQKVAPVWRELAGTHPVISDHDLNGWGKNSGMRVSSYSRVFIFPQIINKMPVALSRLIWFCSELFGRSLPFFRSHGGMLFIAARRE